MDVEKLIRRLRNDADAYRNGETLGRAFADQEDVLDNAATALSTLQAENEKLRAEVESLKKGYFAGCSIPAVKAEQIRDLTDAPKLRAELEQVKMECDAAKSTLAERIGVRGAEPITTAFGLPIDRLRELAKADREGRCVVLPCKVEDDVYINILGRTLPFTVISISHRRPGWCTRRRWPGTCITAGLGRTGTQRFWTEKERRETMSRLTYKSKDGSWGLKGLSWEQLVALPPRVYGALAKLKQMEDLVDDIGGAQPSVGELALEELLTMGTDGIQADLREARAWYQKRFETVT